MVPRLLRITFWAALLFAFTMAVIPAPPEFEVSDKLQHIVAFFVLTALAVLSYGNARPLAVFVSMAAFGAFIEIVQGRVSVHRDADVKDWLADMAAILVALVIAWPIRHRLTRWSGNV